MNGKYFPRVLLINGEPLNNRSATGITLSNLFCGWPLDRVAQIYTANLSPDRSLCANNLKLSARDMWAFGFYHRLKDALRERRPTARDEGARSLETDASLNARMRGFLTPWMDLFPYRLSDELVSRLNEFKPEVIYSTLGNIRLLRLVNGLSEGFSIPVVPHFMDDWLSTYSSRGKSVTSMFQRRIVGRLTNEVMARSTHGMAIGEMMAEEYGRRFALPFTAFMNPVPIDGATSGCRAVTPTAGNEKVGFVYVGGLHLGRIANILDIGKAVARLRSSGLDVEFSVYTPDADLEMFRDEMISTGGVTLCGSIPPEQVQEVLRHSDVAIHVESFVESMSQYTRLSVSTKIPQYFAAGLPVLVYGPPKIASCRYVVDNECGLGVDEKGEGALDAAIGELALNRELRERLGRSAFGIALEKHDASVEQERFRSCIESAATCGRIVHNCAI